MVKGLYPWGLRVDTALLPFLQKALRAPAPAGRG